MNVLVAGGAGFIGFHLCMRLLAEGHDVTVMDTLVTGSTKNLDKCYRFADKMNRYFIHVDLDVSTGPQHWVPNFDVIYHLASPASPKWYAKDPISTIKSNVLGSFSLLNLGVKHKSKVIFASTSEIYGDPLVHPQKESYWGNVNTVGPRSNYDESKRCAETIFYEYRKQIDTKIARIFNTYGPNMRLDDGRVVSNFIINALTGKDLVINGDGTRTRSFTYVSDLVDGLFRLAHSKEQGPINLGNPTEFKIIELAELVLKMTNSKSRVVYAPDVIDEPTIRKPDITTAIEKLDWKPVIPLEDGLALSIPYFESELKANATSANVLFGL